MKKLLSLIATLVLFGASAAMQAQDVASVTGVVQDASGAVVPGAKVALTNPSTGVKLSTTSSTTGAYQFVGVPAGPGYQLTFSHDGFAPYTVTAVYLGVGSSRSQNATLTAGSDVKIEVSAAAQEVTVNTTDATIGNNIDVSKVNDLPVYDRTDGITSLFSLQPGVTATGQVAGARNDQNSVTLDGLDVNDLGFGDNFYIVAKAPIDSVQEFRGTVAGFNSGSGQGGGGQFQLVTKSGTNHFHGNVNEYHRDTDLVANDYFNNFAGLPRAPLVRNQYGGNVGGPILRDKLFFFFNFNQSRIIQSSSQTRIVPLPQAVAGEVGYVNSNTNCDDTSRENTTPNCITYLTPAKVQALDPAGAGDNAAILALYKGRYPAPNDLTLGDGINTAGLRFNAPNDDYQTGYVSRVDYIINSKMSLFGRGSVTRENSVYALNEFPGDPSTYPNIDRSYAYVVGHTWQLSSTKTNEFIYGETKQNLSRKTLYDPEGIYVPTFFSGTTQLLSDPYLGPNGNSRIIPVQQISDNYNWTHNKHNFTMGATFKWIHSHTSLASDYNVYYVGLGGQTQGLNAATRPVDLYNSATTHVNYDEAFTSILGRVGQINETYNFNNAGTPLPQGSGSQRQYRYFESELYFQDNFKLTRDLTLNYGLTYDLMSVPYEMNGAESVPNTTFDQYMRARVAQSAAGSSGYGAVPLISYYLGGKVNNGPALYGPSHNNFAPRVGLNFAPKSLPKTTFSASGGIIYDRTVVNALLSEQDQYSYLFQQPNSVPFGNSSDPTGSLGVCTTPGNCGSASPRYGGAAGSPTIDKFNQVPTTVSAPYAPFYGSYLASVAAMNPQTGLQNGGDFNVSVDPALRNPYSIMTTFGAQHEFKGGFVLKANYVGRYGRRLLAQADANQLVEFKDPTSGELLSTAMGNITKDLRAGQPSDNLKAEPFWENQLSGGIGTDPATGNPYPNYTSYLADSLNSLVSKGDFADTVQAAASGFGLSPNVGMGAQFSENTFFTSKGFSTYQALLTTLSKNLSHGLQFDFNYTYAHSIDNVSLIANSFAFNGYGFVCDVLHPRLCRGESDFDVKHTFTADVTYQLPVGRGQMFLSSVPWYVNELIGGWEVSGITTGHSGASYSTVASAFVASYSNDAPAIFSGNKSAIQHGIHKTTSGSINLYANPAAAVAAFQGPIGFQIGSRNSLRGPRYFNQDLGLGKTFKLLPSHDVNFKLRADAFNVLNHENFANIGTLSAYDDPTQASTFGNLTSSAGDSTGSGYRILQVSGRIEF